MKQEEIDKIKSFVDLFSNDSQVYVYQELRTGMELVKAKPVSVRVKKNGLIQYYCQTENGQNVTSNNYYIDEPSDDEIRIPSKGEKVELDNGSFVISSGVLDASGSIISDNGNVFDNWKGRDEKIKKGYKKPKEN